MTGRSKPATQSAISVRAAAEGASLAVRTPQAILEAHADMLRRLRLHAACDESRFALRFVGPLLRLAHHLNVLPASDSGPFSGEMGLFRACLEAAFYSFQASDGHIFTASEGVERRHALEGRWRYVCFLAALLRPVGRPLQRVVLQQSDGEDWKRRVGGVTAWAESAGADRLCIGWREPEDGQAIGPSPAILPLLPVVVGRENLHMLQEGDGELVTALCQLAAGQAAAFSIAHQTVAGCWERIAERNAPHPRHVPESTSSDPVPGARSMRDAPPARYADLLPADLREEIHATLHAEALGKIVHAWRHRDEASSVMCRVENGAAIEFGFLTTAIANVPVWLDAMARCGLVHAPAQAPGLRIQKVTMAAGEAPVQALVLSNLACRRLGL